MAVDALNELLTLLSDNWNSANTDSKTPDFNKITDLKRIDFNDNQDHILGHRNQPMPEPAGIGPLAKRVTARITIDVRVHGNDQEAHFFNVIEEVDRILEANMNTGTTSFDIIKPDSPNRNDLSDKMHNVWRMLIPVELVDLVKLR